MSFYSYRVKGKGFRFNINKSNLSKLREKDIVRFGKSNVGKIEIKHKESFIK